MKKTYTIRTITPIVEEGEGKTVLAVQVWDRTPDTVNLEFRTRDEALYFHRVTFANECVELEMTTDEKMTAYANQETDRMKREQQARSERIK